MEASAPTQVRYITYAGWQEELNVIRVLISHVQARARCVSWNSLLVLLEDAEDVARRSVSSENSYGASCGSTTSHLPRSTSDGTSSSSSTGASSTSMDSVTALSEAYKRMDSVLLAIQQETRLCAAAESRLCEASALMHRAQLHCVARALLVDGATAAGRDAGIFGKPVSTSGVSTNPSVPSTSSFPFFSSRGRDTRDKDARLGEHQQQQQQQQHKQQPLMSSLAYGAVMTDAEAVLRSVQASLAKSGSSSSGSGAEVGPPLRPTMSAAASAGATTANRAHFPSVSSDATSLRQQQHHHHHHHMYAAKLLSRIFQRQRTLLLAEAQDYLAASWLWLRAEEERSAMFLPTDATSLTHGVVCVLHACGLLLLDTVRPDECPEPQRTYTKARAAFRKQRSEEQEKERERQHSPEVDIKDEAPKSFPSVRCASTDHKDAPPSPPLLVPSPPLAHSPHIALISSLLMRLGNILVKQFHSMEQATRYYELAAAVLLQDTPQWMLLAVLMSEEEERTGKIIAGEQRGGSTSANSHGGNASGATAAAAAAPAATSGGFFAGLFSKRSEEVEGSDKAHALSGAGTVAGPDKARENSPLSASAILQKRLAEYAGSTIGQAQQQEQLLAVYDGFFHLFSRALYKASVCASQCGDYGMALLYSKTLLMTMQREERKRCGENSTLGHSRAAAVRVITTTTVSSSSPSTGVEADTVADFPATPEQHVEETARTVIKSDESHVNTLLKPWAELLNEQDDAKSNLSSCSLRYSHQRLQQQQQQQQGRHELASTKTASPGISQRAAVVGAQSMLSASSDAFFRQLEGMPHLSQTGGEAASSGVLSGDGGVMGMKMTQVSPRAASAFSAEAAAEVDRGQHGGAPCKYDRTSAAVPTEKGNDTAKLMDTSNNDGDSSGGGEVQCSYESHAAFKLAYLSVLLRTHVLRGLIALLTLPENERSDTRTATRFMKSSGNDSAEHHSVKREEGTVSQGEEGSDCVGDDNALHSIAALRTLATEMRQLENALLYVQDTHDDGDNSGGAERQNFFFSSSSSSPIPALLLLPKQVPAEAEAEAEATAAAAVVSRQTKAQCQLLRSSAYARVKERALIKETVAAAAAARATKASAKSSPSVNFLSTAEPTGSSNSSDFHGKAVAEQKWKSVVPVNTAHQDPQQQQQEQEQPQSSVGEDKSRSNEVEKRTTHTAAQHPRRGPPLYVSIDRLVACMTQIERLVQTLVYGPSSHQSGSTQDYKNALRVAGSELGYEEKEDQMEKSNCEVDETAAVAAARITKGSQGALRGELVALLSSLQVVLTELGVRERVLVTLMERLRTRVCSPLLAMVPL